MAVEPADRPTPSGAPFDFGALPDDGPLPADAVRAALDAGLVEVHYQPVVALPSRHVVGFEALARLRLPDGRLVAPGRFVPQAEQAGLVVRLGHDVLRIAAAEAARWRAGGTAVATATLSVNVAAPQLEQPGFLDDVRAVLAEHDLPGSALVLEITESIATSGRVRPVLESLAALGVRVALDDFGTGFATLQSLRRLPVQVVKLDRSFVAGVGEPGADRSIVRVVIDLAESLGLSVIAEGVETAEQADVLVRLGCGHVQGFLFARPGPVPEVVAAGVASTVGPPKTATWRSTDDGWSPADDAALLSAARLLASGDDRERAAVHAVATQAARLAGLPEEDLRAVGRLALVHDLHRLCVDGALPSALASLPRFARLAELLVPHRGRGVRGVGPAGRDGWLLAASDPHLHRAVRDDAVLHLLLHAAEAVGEAARIDPDLGVAALGTGLGLVAGHYAYLDDCGSAAAAADAVAILVRLSLEPPALLPLADLLDDLDRRRLGRRGMEERLRSLVGITRVLAGSRDSRELMRVALEEARRIVGAASAGLERWERDAAQLRTLVNVGTLAPGEETFPTDETYALADYPQIKRSIFDGLPYIAAVDDPDLDPVDHELLKSLHKHSSAAVPVYLEGRVWGQLWLTTEAGEPAFRAADIELLTAVATLMGIVVLRAETLERSARLAFEDQLTGVGNRRALDDALAELAAAGGPVALALLDVDLLRRINTVAGPARGDEALVRLAVALSARTAGHPGAVVARLGGDEFCVVLPGAAAEAMQALLAGVEDDLRRADGPQVSTGTAVAVGPWEPRTLLAVADAQLARAKQRSRRTPPSPRRADPAVP